MNNPKQHHFFFKKRGALCEKVKNPPARREESEKSDFFHFFRAETKTSLLFCSEKRARAFSREDTERRAKIRDPLSFFLRTHLRHTFTRALYSCRAGGNAFLQNLSSLRRLKRERERERERLETHAHARTHTQREKERERNFGQIAPLRLRVARLCWSDKRLD